MTMQTNQRRMLATILTGALLGATSLTTAIARNDADTSFDQSVVDTLRQCRQVSTSCSDTTKGAYGILVFPSVLKADVIIGGAGGKGALIEDGKITGYYNIGAGSAGLQVGIENASQVYVFRTQGALAKLKQGPDWKVGATADVDLVTADTNSSSVNGSVLAYVFGAKGLNAGISLDIFDVWKDGAQRPSQS